MPKHSKRSKRSEKGASKESSKASSKESSKASSKASSTKGAPQPSSDADRGSLEGFDPAEPLPTGAAVDERGAFAIARCDRCGWQGTARRSRDRARKDLRQHLEDKPKHADHVSLTQVAG